MLIVDGQIGTDIEGAAKFLGRNIEAVRDLVQSGQIRRRGRSWYLYQDLAEDALKLPCYKPKSGQDNTIPLYAENTEQPTQAEQAVRSQGAVPDYRKAQELLQPGEPTGRQGKGRRRHG